MYNRIFKKFSYEIFIKTVLTTYRCIGWTAKIFVVGRDFDMLGMEGGRHETGQALFILKPNCEKDTLSCLNLS